jgi:hypothetical protein
VERGGDFAAAAIEPEDRAASIGIPGIIQTVISAPAPEGRDAVKVSVLSLNENGGCIPVSGTYTAESVER